MASLHSTPVAFVRLASSLVIFLAITACGGGGGGSSTPTVSPPPAPLDTTAPVISLEGDAEMTVEQGTDFVDPGASALSLIHI